MWIMWSNSESVQLSDACSSKRSEMQQQRRNAANNIMLVNYRISMIETAECRLVINYAQMLESFLNASSKVQE